MKDSCVETLQINGVDYVRKDSINVLPELSDRVIVRCRNAGVHVGTLVSRDSDTLVLKNVSRIWRWKGAHDLNVVALSGVNRREYTRISPIVSQNTFTCSDVCEVIPVASEVDLSPCGDCYE